MDQFYQNIQSTHNFKPPALRNIKKDPEIDTIIKGYLIYNEYREINQDTLLDEKSTTIHDKTNKIFDVVIELTGDMYSDLAGKLPFKYFRCNRYIMVMYGYDRNDIITESMKICEGQSISNAYETLYNSLATKV